MLRTHVQDEATPPEIDVDIQAIHTITELGSDCPSPSGIVVHPRQVSDNNDEFVEPPVMDRLPPELMNMIFTYYVAPSGPRRKQSGPTSKPHSGFSTLPSPLLLCRVSKSWRDMVLKNPSLWANIHINAVEPTQHSDSMVHRADASAIRLWTARLGACPSSLSIHTHRNRYSRFPIEATSNSTAIDVPLPSILPLVVLRNVGSLDFRGDAWLTGLGKLTFPAVQSVVVDSDELSRWAYRFNWPTIDFPRLPAVRKAVIRGFMHSMDPRPTTRIPWNQLTHLYLGKEVHCARALMALKATTALQQGCFDVRTGSQIPFAALPESTGSSFLPQLKDLTFLRTSPFGAETWDNGEVSWPNLTHLRLCVEDHLSWNPSFTLSFRSLTSLSLVATTLTAEFDTSVRPILNACPLLDSLALGLQLAKYCPLFQYLAFDSSDPRLRHLTELKLFWGAKNPASQDATLFPYTAMYQMIVSRSEVGMNPVEESGYSFTAAPVPDLGSEDSSRLKKFTLWLPAGPASDCVANAIKKDLVGLEKYSDMKISVVRNRPKRSVWREIFLDHWDYSFGPMFESEDGFV